MPWDLLLIALVNAVVGLLVGWSSIAGFLMPMYYVGALGMDPSAALTLAFFSFFLAAILASREYYRMGSLPLKLAMPLSIGSFGGAIIGVLLNSLIRPDTVKILLYLVVFLSGLSILIREYRKKETPIGLHKRDRLENKYVGLLLGFVTAIICALSGAGGPILVMPLLVIFGVPVRWAVGVAIFDSIFIAIPSMIGYGLRNDLRQLWPALLVGGLTHMLGAYVGSRTNHHIPQKLLKSSVAIFSIVVAVYMILSTVM